MYKTPLEDPPNISKAVVPTRSRSYSTGTIRMPPVSEMTSSGGVERRHSLGRLAGRLEANVAGLEELQLLRESQRAMVEQAKTLMRRRRKPGVYDGYEINTQNGHKYGSLSSLTSAPGSCASVYEPILETGEEPATEESRPRSASFSVGQQRTRRVGVCHIQSPLIQSGKNVDIQTKTNTGKDNTQSLPRNFSTSRSSMVRRLSGSVVHSQSLTQLTGDDESSMGSRTMSGTQLPYQFPSPMHAVLRQYGKSSPNGPEKENINPAQVRPTTQVEETPRDIIRRKEKEKVELMAKHRRRFSADERLGRLRTIFGDLESHSSGSTLDLSMLSDEGIVIPSGSKESLTSDSPRSSSSFRSPRSSVSDNDIDDIEEEASDLVASCEKEGEASVFDNTDDTDSVLDGSVISCTQTLKSEDEGETKTVPHCDENNNGVTSNSDEVEKDNAELESVIAEKNTESQECSEILEESIYETPSPSPSDCSSTEDVSQPELPPRPRTLSFSSVRSSVPSEGYISYPSSPRSGRGHKVINPCDVSFSTQNSTSDFDDDDNKSPMEDDAHLYEDIDVIMKLLRNKKNRNSVTYSDIQLPTKAPRSSLKKRLSFSTGQMVSSIAQKIRRHSISATSMEDMYVSPSVVQKETIYYYKQPVVQDTLI